MHILEMLLDGILNGYEHMFRWASVDPAKAMEVCSFIIKQPEMPIGVNKLYRQQEILTKLYIKINLHAFKTTDTFVAIKKSFCIMADITSLSLTSSIFHKNT